MPDYSSNLYVVRCEFDEVLKHLRGEATGLVSLVGPPGCGKSWILKRLCEASRETNQAQEKMLFLDVMAIFPDRQWNEDRAKAAIGQLASDAGIKQTWDEMADPLIWVKNLMSGLLSIHPHWLLLVDGLDLFAKEQQTMIENQILLPFWNRGKLLLAHRNPRLFHYQLRTSQKLVWVSQSLNTNEQFEQFKRLWESKVCPSPCVDWLDKLEKWKSQRNQYCWDHPFINAAMFERCYQNKDQSLRLWGKDDLEQVLQELITRPTATTGAGGYPPLNVGQRRLLNVLADRRAPWLPRDIRAHLSQPYNDPDLTFLRQAGLIEYVEEKSQVVPAIGRFVKEIEGA